ncbi:MAG: TonB-dependent receptor plug domain-containing protein [Bacteroidaceae bacterium]
MRIIPSLLFILISISTLSQTAYLDSVERVWMEKELNQIVVTGTRTPKLLKDVPVPTRLISESDLRKADATNIQNLLMQELPGVEFSYAMNQQTHLNMAGFGGQGILFLVDGERLAGETMDDIDFSRLTMNNVERIEISKGASSALYGSNAGGGVINIITKEVSLPFIVNLSGRYGRHNAQRYSGTLGTKRQTWQNTLTSMYSQSDSYNVTSADNPSTRIISTIYGDRNLNVRDQFSYRPLPQLKFTARAGYYLRQTSRTSDLTQQYMDMSGGMRGLWDITSKDQLELSYSFDQYDKADKQRLTGLNLRRYSNVQNILRALYCHSFAHGHILTAGADYLHDYLYNENLEGNRCEQDCLDAFMQFDWHLSSRWELLTALRYDYLSQGSASQVTPRVNVRYQVLRNLNLRMGYGMGFRAPSLKERYYSFDMSGIWMVEGNPDLKSELSHNLNASLEYTRRHLCYNLSAYYNHVTNKIASAAPYFKSPSDGLPYLPYANLASYKVYGGEASVQGNWKSGIGCRLAYALTHEEIPQDKDGTTLSSQYLPARTHALNTRVDYDHQFRHNVGLYLALSGRLLSGTENQEYRNYYDVTEGMVKVHYPAYTLWKMQVTLRIGEHVGLHLTADNLLNYKPQYYYLNCPLTDGIDLQVGATIDI